MSYRRILITLGVCALLLAGCASSEAPAPVTGVPTTVPNVPTPAVAEITYRVERGEVAEVLQLNGRVAAAHDQDVAFTKEGYVSALHVQRGDTVTNGQLLAELDPGELSTQLDQARADLVTLQSSAASARERQRFAVEMARVALATANDNLAKARRPTSESVLASARDELDKARLEVANTRNSMSAAKVQAEAAVHSTANALRDLQDAYSQVVWANGNKPLDQLDPVARARQEQAQRAITDGESRLRLAKVAYDLAVQNEISAVRLAEQQVAIAERKIAELEKGPDPIEVKLAERGVEAARVVLAQAQAAQNDPEMAAREQQAQHAIDEIQQQIAAGNIYAPFDGVVGEVGAKVGDRVEVYAPAINIYDPAQLLLVVTDIASADLARLSPGQGASVAFGRYPQQAITATIEELPADQTAIGSQVRGNQFLRVAFERSALALDIGDSAGITVIFGRAPDALWLPPAALRHFGGQTFVVTQNSDGEQRKVEVTVGLATAERVQILSGLHEGDVVVVASERES